MKRLLVLFGKVLSFIYPYRLYWFLHNSVWRYIYTGWISRDFKHWGKGSTICSSARFLIGRKYVSIGENVYIGSQVTINALDKFNQEFFHPEITIGNNCHIGDEADITSIEAIKIGNCVVLGKRVFITDNAHGASVKKLLQMSPYLRPLYSKGPVVIEDYVFIGEKVSIMPGVTIGTGSIIGANAVVTKDIPPYSVAIGVPAMVVRRMDAVSDKEKSAAKE